MVVTEVLPAFGSNLFCETIWLPIDRHYHSPYLCDMFKPNQKFSPKSFNMRLLILVLFLVCSLSLAGQSVPDSTILIKTSTLVVGKTFTTTSGKVYNQVFQGAKGGLFVIRRSGKTGLYYKDYLPKAKV